jgi:two-component system chemotaxis response regulator CheB
MTIRVLVVDDSAVARRLLAELLAEAPGVEVVGTAASGTAALGKLAQLAPDVVTVDVEMPGLSGPQAVVALREARPGLPVVMFYSANEARPVVHLDFIAAGARHYVAKPVNGGLEALRAVVHEQLVPEIEQAVAHGRRVEQALAVTRGTGSAPPRRRLAVPVPAGRRPAGPASRPTALVIGSSTGGPDALLTVVARLPADLPVPVLVVQHMPPVFTRQLAERLNARCDVRVKEAEDGDPVRRGEVLVAPGGEHLLVEQTRDGVVARVSDDPPENFSRPSVDVLFRSAARVFGAGTVGVVLTGMGRDGAAGAQEIRNAGGQVLAQDEGSSVVWGMAAAVVRGGLATRVVALQDMGEAILEVLRPAGPLVRDSAVRGAP